jgi:hypothetical protein
MLNDELFTHVQRNSDVIDDNKAFENEICKIEGRLELALTRDENYDAADDDSVANEREGYREEIFK